PAQEEHPAGDGWRGPAHLVDAVGPQYLELLAGLDHEGSAILVQTEDLAVIGPGRRGEAAPARQPLSGVQGIAGSGVVTGQTAALQDVEQAAVDERRSRGRARASPGPGHPVVAGAVLLESDVARGAGLDGVETARVEAAAAAEIDALLVRGGAGIEGACAAH